MALDPRLSAAFSSGTLAPVPDAATRRDLKLIASPGEEIGGCVLTGRILNLTGGGVGAGAEVVIFGSGAGAQPVPLARCYVGSQTWGLLAVISGIPFSEYSVQAVTNNCSVQLTFDRSPLAGGAPVIAVETGAQQVPTSDGTTPVVFSSYAGLVLPSIGGVGQPTTWKDMITPATSGIAFRSPVTAYEIAGANLGAANRYLQIFDAIAVPANGNTPKETIPVGAGQAFSRTWTRGRKFGLGFVWAVSSTIGTLTIDNTATFVANIESAGI